MRMLFHLYILECKDGTLYTGIAVDVARRVREHNVSARGAKYTRGRRPVRLVFARAFRSRSAALRAEHCVKRLSRASKREIVQARFREPLNP